jgi:hypothetical protein
MKCPAVGFELIEVPIKVVSTAAALITLATLLSQVL